MRLLLRQSLIEIDISFPMEGNKSGPSFVIKVGYHHQNFDLLLRQAEVYLNGFTNIEYCLMIDVTIEGGMSVRKII